MGNLADHLKYTKVLITPKGAKLVLILKITNFFEKKHKKIQNRASNKKFQLIGWWNTTNSNTEQYRPYHHWGGVSHDSAQNKTKPWSRPIKALIKKRNFYSIFYDCESFQIYSAKTCNHNSTLSHYVAKFIISRIISFAVNKNLRVTYQCQDINE